MARSFGATDGVNAYTGDLVAEAIKAGGVARSVVLFEGADAA